METAANGFVVHRGRISAAPSRLRVATLSYIGRTG